MTCFDQLCDPVSLHRYSHINAVSDDLLYVSTEEHSYGHVNVWQNTKQIHMAA
jgi:hypothetical protein